MYKNVLSLCTGCLTPLTNRDPEKAADIPKQGMKKHTHVRLCHVLRCIAVPLLDVFQLGLVFEPDHVVFALSDSACNFAFKFYLYKPFQEKCKAMYPVISYLTVIRKNSNCQIISIWSYGLSHHLVLQISNWPLERNFSTTAQPDPQKVNSAGWNGGLFMWNNNSAMGSNALLHSRLLLVVLL